MPKQLIRHLQNYNLMKKVGCHRYFTERINSQFKPRHEVMEIDGCMWKEYINKHRDRVQTIIQQLLKLKLEWKRKCCKMFFWSIKMHPKMNPQTFSCTQYAQKEIENGDLPNCRANKITLVIIQHPSRQFQN